MLFLTDIPSLLSPPGNHRHMFCLKGRKEGRNVRLVYNMGWMDRWTDIYPLCVHGNLSKRGSLAILDYIESDNRKRKKLLLLVHYHYLCCCYDQNRRGEGRVVYRRATRNLGPSFSNSAITQSVMQGVPITERIYIYKHTYIINQLPK